jgi:uncharacterized membrane protein YbhN (UPF0104 family)
MSALALFAQAAEATNPNDIPTGVFVFFGIIAVAAVTITAIVTGISHANKIRELQHAERMKALERGIPLDELEEERRFRKGILLLAFGIGVVVPVCAAGAATGAVTGMGSHATSMIVFLICTGASAVGVTAVASGAWLAQGAITRLSPGSRRSTAPATSPYPRAYDAPEAVAR